MSDVEALRAVSFLSMLDDETLQEVASRARRQRFRSGERLVSELEAGADVYVVVEGEVEVSVDGGRGDPQRLTMLHAGGAIGEMSSLTGELRSASATARTDVEVLVIGDSDFDRLRARRPEVAVSLVRTLAERLAETERSIDALITPASEDEARKSLALVPGAGAKMRRASIGRIFRELVVAHKEELPFLTLVGFGATLLLVRVIVFAAFRLQLGVFLILRIAIVAGFALLVASSCAALLTFRPGFRRFIAIGYGVGLALIANELGVTLAFDIFYKDIHTPDPEHPFDIERLYRRTEALRAIVLGALVMVQAVYLRRFYRRAGFVVMTRLRRLVSKLT